MSAKNSQGTFLVLLLLVAGNVGLAITGYRQWDQRERAAEQARQAAAERDRAKQGHAAAIDRLGKVKQRVSRQPDVDFEQFMAGAEDDIRQFGGGTPNETYADVVRHQQALLGDTRTHVQQVTADYEDLQKRYLALEKIKQVAVDQATAAREESNQELSTERAENLRRLSAKDNDIMVYMDKALSLAHKLETEKRDKAKIREDLLTQINRLRTILMDARAPYTPDALARQKPDGKVVRASTATKTAWLNIGSKHGVQPQLTFSVQPPGFNGNPFTKPKAKLEVVKVMGPNMSEARIVEAALLDPVIEGDEIYNPAWDPGKVVRFALAGLMDIDGDGVDDRDKVRKIIEKAGARIDAEVLPDGTERGELTVETNYFVRGAHPDPDKGGLAEARVVAAMARMQRMALEYGAVVIDLSKFLDLMGYATPEQLRSASRPRLSTRP
ncbi:MAG: hypothetical protein HY000_00945 [Planctomycetes bacterium]|nr:hypothetical protein [Planctomycetota bacterium]